MVREVGPQQLIVGVFKVSQVTWKGQVNLHPAPRLLPEIATPLSAILLGEVLRDDIGAF